MLTADAYQRMVNAFNEWIAASQEQLALRGNRGEMWRWSCPLKSRRSDVRLWQAERAMSKLLLENARSLLEAARSGVTKSAP